MIRITVFQDGESMGTGAYDVERVLLGSAADVDLRVQEPGVLPEHAEVYSSGERIYVRRLGEAPIWVSGEEVERCELKTEDRLKIGGPVEFNVTFRKVAKTGKVKRTGAVSFGSVPTYDEKDLEEEAPSNEPMDLTEASPETKAHLKQSVAERAAEQDKEEKRKAVLSTVILTVGLMFCIAVVYFGIVPTIRKFFFYEDDPLPTNH